MLGVIGIMFFVMAFIALFSIFIVLLVKYRVGDTESAELFYIFGFIMLVASLIPLVIWVVGIVVVSQ